MREKRKVYKVLFGIADCKWPIGRPRYRLDDNVKIDLKETGWKGRM
jgi:hypothetical protein